MKPALLIALALSFLPVPVMAQDISPLYCDKLAQESAYDANKLSAYKILSLGKDGWVFRTRSDYKQDLDLKKTALNHLDTMNKALQDKGTTLVMVFIPTRGMMNYGQITDEDKKAYNVSPETMWDHYQKRIDALGTKNILAIGATRDTAKTIPFFFKRDHHWRPEGAQYMAEHTAAAIKKLPAYQGIKQQRFTTVLESTKDFKGTFTKTFKTLCGNPLPPEKLPVYVTNATGGTDAKALLDDAASPSDIVLIGTSNSANGVSDFNFDGFLKEHLNADLLNLAITGGGTDEAMLDFLSSERFASNPPKILIWELPAYYDLNKTNSFYKKAEELLK